MLIRNVLLTFSIALAALQLSGCYRMDIQQGNHITLDDMRKVHRGMSVEQVYSALGYPVLIHPYNINYLTYVYTLEPSHKPMKRTRLFVYFQNRRVTSMWTDMPPPSTPSN